MIAVLMKGDHLDKGMHIGRMNGNMKMTIYKLREWPGTDFVFSSELSERTNPADTLISAFQLLELRENPFLFKPHSTA